MANTHGKSNVKVSKKTGKVLMRHAQAREILSQCARKKRPPLLVKFPLKGVVEVSRHSGKQANG